MQRSPQQQTPDQLQYPWPPNLTSYEAKVLLGLTAMEVVAAGVGFLLPAVLVRGLAGVLLGALAALLVLLTIKPLDALGGLSLPVYIVLRFLAGRRPQAIELPLILGGQSGPVEIETWEGETLMVVGEEPE